MSENVCAFCRRWKAGMQSNRDTLLETLAYRECHVKQPQETRADETCPMWTEVGTA